LNKFINNIGNTFLSKKISISLHRLKNHEKINELLFALVHTINMKIKPDGVMLDMNAPMPSNFHEQFGPNTGDPSGGFRGGRLGRSPLPSRKNFRFSQQKRMKMNFYHLERFLKNDFCRSSPLPSKILDPPLGDPYGQLLPHHPHAQTVRNSNKMKMEHREDINQHMRGQLS
jgi:hypothetical protein